MLNLQLPALNLEQTEKDEVGPAHKRCLSVNSNGERT